MVFYPLVNSNKKTLHFADGESGKCNVIKEITKEAVGNEVQRYQRNNKRSCWTCATTLVYKKNFPKQKQIQSPNNILQRGLHLYMGIRLFQPYPQQSAATRAASVHGDYAISTIPSAIDKSISLTFRDRPC